MRVIELASRAIAAVFIFLVRLYQWFLSPLKNALVGPGGGCRFRPTCSSYAITCLRTQPLGKALYLSAWRILRCNPWGGSGYDPVPSRMSYRGDREAKSNVGRSLKDLL
ncbi:membrane protein insertion efficiency factor YidD [Pelagicoccus sp. SDUM812003]|uniref:membrane protein insertion efficiency factor YidD n=1 Tax=Pelagicoccus sp. SDUM812003 TaxID=3041267 RepID=UPI00280F99E6|nr:membrane protein insertion efficiency factor YidD [Pelagicoccus sp. SDUM812003]MDQ8201523.1 membrane protein insertion efficiency factor YidD [Pelagicoccus sp. SDUM812003]